MDPIPSSELLESSHTFPGVYKLKVIGIANYLIHEHTLGMTPACYLGDLFVDPEERAAGVGQQLIDWLVREMKAQRWCRLYWHTRNTNYRARGLYDKFTPHSDFVRYTVYPPSH